MARIRHRADSVGWPLLALASTVALVIFISLGPLSGQVRGDRDRWLLRVATTDERAVARLADEGARPVWIAPDFTLVLATPAEETIPALRAAGAERIAPWDPEALVLLVYLEGVRGAGPPLESLARVLYRDRRSAVVEADEAQAARLVEEYRAVRIVDRPLRLSRGLARNDVEAARARRAAHDPSIQTMVDQVDIPSMQAKVNALVAFGTRRSTTSGGVQAQNWLVQQFQALGYADVSTFSYNSWTDNVICVKPGAATPDRIYIIGGHYDSISNVSGNAPGADDNASGITGVLEAARILQPYEFQSTIYFIGWSGEEEGLVGSGAWVDWALQQGLDIRAYLNLDMEGYLSDQEDLDILSNGSSEWLRDLAFETIPLYVPTLPLVDGFLTSGSSDHASFWNGGYAAVFFFEDSDHYSPYIHTTSDVVGLSLNNYGFMKKNVQAAIATLATLAEPFTIAIIHQPLGDTAVTDQPYPVTAEIIGAAPLLADSVRVHYRTDGGAFASIRLLPTGNPNEFAASIPAQPAGTQVDYYLRARDQAGHAKNDPAGAPADLHSFRTGVETVFADDAEIDRGWTFGAAGDNATTGLWLRADPVGTDFQPENDHTPDPGHICFVTGNGAIGGGNGDQDVDGGRTTLTSPVFSLEGATWAKISYWRWYVDATSLDDDFYVSISNDGGATWLPLETVGQSAYPWTLASFPDLAQVLPLTSQMRLRFVAEDVGSGSLVEAAIDDLLVTAVLVNPDAVEAAASAGGLRLHPAQPNPTASGSRIGFDLPRAGQVSLAIYDVSGRLVRLLWRGPAAAGSHGATWDGRDASGRAAPAGLYWARLETAEGRRETRVALIR